MIVQRIPVILASKSPRRVELLKKLGVSFEVIKPNIAEKIQKCSKPPQKVVIRLAKKKALSVVKKIKNIKKPRLIIGADTIVVAGNKIFGKPKNQKEAEKMLFSLIGTTHYVYTGVAIVKYPEMKIYTTYSRSKIIMRDDIPKKAIISLARKHKDKAGSYAVQEKNDRLVEKVVGDYYTVVGLPIYKIERYFNRIRLLKNIKS
jgi:septum formation protein